MLFDTDHPGEIHHLLFLCGALYFASISAEHFASSEVAATELNWASRSDLLSVQRFLLRTGISSSFMTADQRFLSPAALSITEALEALYVDLCQNNVSQELAAMVRCTIVGYLINESYFGDKSAPLLGRDLFFANCD